MYVLSERQVLDFTKIILDKYAQSIAISPTPPPNDVHCQNKTLISCDKQKQNEENVGLRTISKQLITPTRNRLILPIIPIQSGADFTTEAKEALLTEAVLSSLIESEYLSITNEAEIQEIFRHYCVLELHENSHAVLRNFQALCYSVAKLVQLFGNIPNKPLDVITLQESIDILFSPRFIKELHIILMYRSTGVRVGDWRQKNVWIGAPGTTKEQAIAIPAHFSNVDAYMRKWHELIKRVFDNLVSCVSDVAQAQEHDMRFVNQQLKNLFFNVNFILYATFESIHPFEDGNGRIGRIVFMLLNLITAALTTIYFKNTNWDMSNSEDDEHRLPRDASATIITELPSAQLTRCDFGTHYKALRAFQHDLSQLIDILDALHTCR